MHSGFFLKRGLQAIAVVLNPKCLVPVATAIAACGDRRTVRAPSLLFAAGFVRLCRVHCATQQPAAAGQPEGSAPAGSSSPPSADGDGNTSPRRIDWATAELRFWKVFSTVGLVGMLAMLYPFMTFFTPVIGHVAWGVLTVYMLTHLIMFPRA